MGSDHFHTFDMFEPVMRADSFPYFRSAAGGAVQTFFGVAGFFLPPAPSASWAHLALAVVPGWRMQPATRCRCNPVQVRSRQREAGGAVGQWGIARVQPCTRNSYLQRCSRQCFKSQRTRTYIRVALLLLALFSPMAESPAKSNMLSKSCWMMSRSCSDRALLRMHM
jgi:hypothetical protein